MNNLAPIVLFVYNRVEHTKKTIDSLKKNYQASESKLYIFSDGSANDEKTGSVSEVRNFIKNISGFKEINIIEREKNLGLANSIINGVSEIIEEYEKVIVLEDDLLTSKNFLIFMNVALNEFADVDNIYSVSGYSFPIYIPKDYKEEIYITHRASSWGWATWKSRWLKTDWDVSSFDSFIKDKSAVAKFNQGGNDLTKMLRNQIEGKIDSWAIRWIYTHFKNNAYCIYPVKSKIQNIGTDSSGSHTVTTNKYLVNLDTSHEVEKLNQYIAPDDRILKSFKNFFNFSIWEKIYWKAKRILK